MEQTALSKQTFFSSFLFVAKIFLDWVVHNLEGKKYAFQQNLNSKNFSRSFFDLKIKTKNISDSVSFKFARFFI